MSMSTSTRIGLGAFLVVMTIALGFFWKVFIFYRGIKDGSITPSDVSYHKTLATSDILARIVQSAPGSGELATTDDPTVGKKDARVTIVEFADFGCPYSQEEAPMLRALATLYPEDIRFIYRDFPLEDLHPGATLAAKAGECASEQGKFWEFHDALFKTNDTLTGERFEEITRTLGLRQPAFVICMNAPYYDQEIIQDQADAVVAGVVGTPTLFVNGVKIEGNIPYATLKALIDSFLAG